MMPSARLLPLAFVLVPSLAVSASLERCPEEPPAERAAKYPQLKNETRFASPAAALVLPAEGSLSLGKVTTAALYDGPPAESMTLEPSNPPRAYATGVIGEKRLKEQLRDGWENLDVKKKVQEVVGRLIPDGKEACSRRKYDDFMTAMLDVTAGDDQLFWRYFSDRDGAIRARSLDEWEVATYDSLVTKCEALLRGCFEPVTFVQSSGTNHLDRALGALVIDEAPPQCTALRVSEHYAITAKHCVYYPEDGRLRANLRAGAFWFQALNGRRFEVCSVVTSAAGRFASPGSQDLVGLRIAPDPGGAADVVPAPMDAGVGLALNASGGAAAPLQMLEAYSFFPGADRHFGVPGASSFVRSKRNTCFLVAASGGLAYSGCNTTFRASGGPVFAISNSTQGPMGLLGIHGGTFAKRPESETGLPEAWFPMNAAAIVSGDFVRQFAQ